MARRRAGALAERIVALLAQAPGPLGGLELVERLRDGGDPAAPSLVFRALRQLVDAGKVQKLLLARGYLLRDGDQPLYLHCRHCGAILVAPGEAVRAAVEAAAGRAGFRTHRIFAELPGCCADCARKRDRRGPVP
ncbi:Fe2+ or Zn2+ uptake regulation protein [Sphingomonas leidyi]|uniref:Fe2+ or Zn2+ uptake regulation protein n=1 Tax=Sphingomonas leidyi TaxID=68569 RepID=A0A7X5V2M7_9SPHN|nr:hypothetical protein [Sphingomonas leidyi]NIJ66653.1 Fe2+ or Zn2+ uptake regulation protein [Sphingomonas leidyi]